MGMPGIEWEMRPETTTYARARAKACACRKKLPFGLASSRVPPNNRTYRQSRALRNRSGSPTAGYSLVNP